MTPGATREEIDREIARLRARESQMDQRLLERVNRTDNTLQMIVSLLSLQMEGEGPAAAWALERAMRRIHAVGQIQSILESRSRDDRTDLVPVLSDLVVMVAEQAGPGLSVKFAADVSSVSAHMSEARALCLVVSELVTNALIHGYPDGRGGHVVVAVTAGASGQAMVAVSDDGVGLDYDPTIETGSGLSICRALLRSAGSDLRLVTGPGMAIFEFIVPLAEPKP